MKTDFSNAILVLSDNPDHQTDVFSEWDFITDKLWNAKSFHQLRNEIQREYAGRGPAYEVPTDETIQKGLEELVADGIVVVS